MQSVVLDIKSAELIVVIREPLGNLCGGPRTIGTSLIFFVAKIYRIMLIRAHVEA